MTRFFKKYAALVAVTLMLALAAVMCGLGGRAFAATVSGGADADGTYLHLSGGARENASISPSNADGYTLSAWIKLGSASDAMFTATYDGADYTLLGNGLSGRYSVSAADENSAYIYGTATHLESQPESNVPRERISTEIFDTDEWSFAVITVDDENIRYYLDGELCFAFSSVFSIDNSAFIDGFLSGLRSGSLYFGGSAANDVSIDGFRIFDEVISSKTEMIRLMGTATETAAKAKYDSLYAGIDITSATAPLFQYDFSNGTANQGSATNAAAVLGGDAAVANDGSVTLDGARDWIQLPSLAGRGLTAFTLSFDFLRSESTRNDTLFYFSDEAGPLSGYVSIADAEQDPTKSATKGKPRWIDARINSTGGNGFIYLDIYDNRQVGSTSKLYRSNLVSVDSGWHTMTVSYDGSVNGGTWKYYLNGNLFFTQEDVAVDLNKYTYCYIGGINYNLFDTTNYDQSYESGKTEEDAYFDRKYFKGSVDNISLFGYAANAGQVAWLANAVESVTVDVADGTTSASAIGNGYAVEFNKCSSFDFVPDFSLVDMTNGARTYATYGRTGTKYPITVKIRSLVNATGSKTVNAIAENVLPSEAVFSYTDSSTETLPLDWSSSTYSFNKGERVYTATATDAFDRSAEYTLTVTGEISNSDLSDLVAIIDAINSTDYVERSVTEFNSQLEPARTAAEGVTSTSASYESVYLDLASAYLSAKTSLISAQPLRLALSEYTDEKGYADSANESARTRYNAALTAANTCLRLAESADEITAAVTELRTAYFGLYMRSALVGLTGSVESESGYAFSVLSNLSSEENFISTNYLDGDFRLTFTAACTNAFMTGESYAAVTVNTETQGALQLRFFQFFNSVTTATAASASLTDKDLAALEARINDLTVAYERETVAARKTALAQELLTVSGNYESMLATKNMPETVKSVFDTARPLTVTLTRTIDSDSSVFEATISQSGESRVFSATLDYDGAVQLVIGAKYTGYRVSDLSILGKSDGDLDSTRIIGEATTSDDSITTTSPSAVILGGASSRYQDFLSVTTQQFGEISSDSHLTFLISSAAQNARDRITVNLDSGSVLGSFYRSGTDQTAQLEVDFSAGKEYIFILSKMTAGSQTEYSLIVSDEGLLYEVNFSSILSSNATGVSIAYESVTATLSEFSARNLEAVVNAGSVNERLYTASSVAAYKQMVSTIDLTIETLAAMSEHDYNALLGELADLAEILQMAKITNYTKLSVQTYQVGDRINLNRKMTVLYSNDNRAALDVVWENAQIDEDGAQYYIAEGSGRKTARGVVKDLDGSDYIVEFEYIVGSENSITETPPKDDGKNPIVLILVICGAVAIAAAAVVLTIGLIKNKGGKKK